MDINPLLSTLKRYEIHTKKQFFEEAFSRNIGLVSKEEQRILRRSKIAIPGMGGVGGIHLITLVRSGIGNFNIADFDHYEPANINRQFGARIEDLGHHKADIMKDHALSINPFLNFNVFSEGLTAENINQFLEDVDLVIDGLDFFKFDIRRLLFKTAAQKGIPVITAAPLGFSVAMLVFSPDGMGFDEYFNIKDGMPETDKYLNFAIGLAPKATHIKYMDLNKVDFDSKAGPSLNIACQLCSGTAAAEVFKILLGRGIVKPVPSYVQFDPYTGGYKKGKLFFGNRNPIQMIKRMIIKRILSRKGS